MPLRRFDAADITRYDVHYDAFATSEMICDIDDKIAIQRAILYSMIRYAALAPCRVTPLITSFRQRFLRPRHYASDAYAYFIISPR